MNNITSVIKHAILPGLFLCTQSVAGSYAPATVDVDVKQVSEYVYYVEGEAGNRINAYQVYLSMEAELLAQ